ncbi:TPA: hypothetical protein ACGJSI_005915 [Pseudomonas aeruginosa]|uniref:hypothetical protein n=1 Tax=Pseudomonas aeruginosa TaxID=287 RepID=UPI00129874C6|nr:hypothetical protein [Pseudomonas aeruginosa]HCF0024008.1 hypothetical protein [Pseudomonas aeruginosa]
MAANRKSTIGDTRIIEARITRSLRIALAMLVLIAVVIPITESIFVTNSVGTSVMRLIDLVALVAMVLSFFNAYLLDRRLSKSAEL